MYYGRPACRSSLRFNEAQASAWRFSVSSWSVTSPWQRLWFIIQNTRRLPRYSPTSLQQLGSHIYPVKDMSTPPCTPGTWLVPRPGCEGRPADSGASPNVPSRGVEEPLLLVPFLLILVCLGVRVTVAEGPAAPLALAAARAVTEAVAGRIAASLRPPGRAPGPRPRLLLGLGSPRVAQHSAAQRAHGPRLPGFQGGYLGKSTSGSPADTVSRHGPAADAGLHPARVPTRPPSHAQPQPLQRTLPPPSSAPPAASIRAARQDRRTLATRFRNKARSGRRMRATSLRKRRGKGCA